MRVQENAMEQPIEVALTANKDSKSWTQRLDLAILGISLSLLLSFFLWGQFSGESMGSVMKSTLQVLTHQFGWLYLLFGLFLVFFSLWMALGPYAHVKLGADDSKPEFSNFSWFCMLFACGYGVGLVFWGAAEPLYFLSSPPLHLDANSRSAAEIGLAWSFFHWGWTPWAMYLCLTIPVGYFAYRRNMPLRFSSALKPVLKEGTSGLPGRVVDAVLIFALVLGVTTSIGLGVKQFASGLSSQFGFPEGTFVYVAIGVVWCFIFGISAISGIDKGIKLLSGINIPLAMGLMIFVFIVGPSTFILDITCSAFGDYVDNFFKMSTWTDAVDQGGFPQGWTIFYWAWWFACAPTMAIFTSRISKGRTIKEIVIAHMMLAPIATWLWFGTFGGTALWMELKGKLGLVAQMKENGSGSVIYTLLENLPLSGLTSCLFMILIVVFLATSADSISYICSQLCTKKEADTDNPPKPIRALWAVVLGGGAMTLVIFGEGISGLQLSSVIASIVVVFMTMIAIYAMLKDMKEKETRRG